MRYYDPEPVDEVTRLRRISRDHRQTIEACLRLIEKEGRPETKLALLKARLRGSSPFADGLDEGRSV